MTKLYAHDGGGDSFYGAHELDYLFHDSVRKFLAFYQLNYRQLGLF